MAENPSIRFEAAGESCKIDLFKAVWERWVFKKINDFIGASVIMLKSKVRQLASKKQLRLLDVVDFSQHKIYQLIKFIITYLDSRLIGGLKIFKSRFRICFFEKAMYLT